MHHCNLFWKEFARCRGQAREPGEFFEVGGLNYTNPKPARKDANVKATKTATAIS
jgi:hypothetical protein